MDTADDAKCGGGVTVTWQGQGEQTDTLEPRELSMALPGPGQMSKDPANEWQKDALSGGPSRYAGIMMKGNCHAALPGGRTDTF